MAYSINSAANLTVKNLDLKVIAFSKEVSVCVAAEVGFVSEKNTLKTSPWNPARAMAFRVITTRILFLVSQLSFVILGAGSLAADDLPDSKSEKVISNSIGMKLVEIPSGEFLMGNDKYRGSFQSGQAPQHKVTISKGFYLGQTEVTRAEWKAVMGTEPWKGVLFAPPKETDLPANNVSWSRAVEFCAKLSKKEGERYRLPTEAEWEYACRAGSTTQFSFGDDQKDLKDYAWCLSNKAMFAGSPGRVAQKKPNQWKLYDMHGNVREYCQDWYDINYYSVSPGVDPTGAKAGHHHVRRGGDLFHVDDMCRSDDRGSDNLTLDSDGGDGNTGFRVLREK